MNLRSRMIPERPRIEVPGEDSSQEDLSSTAPQCGSPAGISTRSVSASDSQSQQQPLSPIPETPSFTRGQHTPQFGFHEDFILYSQSDTDDGLGEEQAASAGFLSAHGALRVYRTIAPYPEPQSTYGPSSSIQTITSANDIVTAQRHPLMRIQLPEPLQTEDTMISQFERGAGPWSPNEPVNAEERKRALSEEIPGITGYPKDRNWDDKMQEALTKIEKTPEGREVSDEETRRRSKRRRRDKNKSSMMPSKSTKNDDKPRKDGDGRDGSQGGGQAVTAS